MMTIHCSARQQTVSRGDWQEHRRGGGFSYGGDAEIDNESEMRFVQKDR